MRRAARWAAVLLSMGVTQAASVPTTRVPTTRVPAARVQVVRVQVESVPGLTFNRQVPSTVTLTTPWGTQTASLNSGTLYRGDPQHYWASLNPLRLRLNVPAGTAAGRYPVSVRTTLYVCDQTIHLCTVRPTAAQGQLDVGAGFPGAGVAGTGAGPLTLTLRVPSLRGF